MERFAEWVIALFTSTHALVLGVIAALTAAWRIVRSVLVRAALSDVRAETITELREEIDYLRANVDYYQAHHTPGGNDGSASTGTLKPNAPTDSSSSKPPDLPGLTWK